MELSKIPPAQSSQTRKITMRDMTEELIRTGMGRTKAHMIKGLVESGSGDSKAMEESEGKAIVAAESLAKDLRRKLRPLPQNTMGIHLPILAS
ncbi:hypothetical protein MCOR27_006079 [Pyricularia oryzae]|nr:hypothetical protein MCOR19_010898 [Pyricularia oryzae]KAI6264511.1 hypothetical protein MCOR26_011307 [Pyricularia oryzae]KAI6277321.1 hypothetical protein MCOR27_006079 [Pyricularia oryzae]KAI6307347.1 hypothetical protein MCOR34_007628 [Pyricularia oryzae]KAI6319619.1 hypothetical protein MCOR30_008549 [Pyricularia oryzae]